MDLSRIFETMLRILTGLQLLTSNGLFSRKLGLTLANFISSGAIPELIDFLIMIEIGVLRKYIKYIRIAQQTVRDPNAGESSKPHHSNWTLICLVQ